MKIAIITLPLQTNYGGILQAYALQFVLKKMGHEVSTLNGQNSFKNSIRRIQIWTKMIAVVEIIKCISNS